MAITRTHDPKAAPVAEPVAPDFKPTLILEIEIGRPLAAIESCNTGTDDAVHHSGDARLSYERALAFVRLHTQPLGVVELSLQRGGLDAEACARAIWRALQVEICEHLRQDGLPQPEQLTAAGLPGETRLPCLAGREAALADPPFVSIVVATRDRPESLATTLRSLLAQEYANCEIVVVDNAPSSEATADLMRETFIDASKVRYIRENQPGLGCARNRGLQEARGEIIAFTDDDAVVDRHWLSALIGGFAVAQNVACVTGVVFPTELRTPAQLWFEQYGDFSKGFARRIFDRAEHSLKHPMYPYSAGVFGTGVNMAFRTAALRRTGGFDPALGTGTVALGGEELAAFFQIIVAGYALVYEPAAIVHHTHRPDYAGLQKQMYGYGAGLTAHLTKCMIDKPVRLLGVASWLPLALDFARNAASPANSWRPSGFPPALVKIERSGMIHGPYLYLRSRWKTRRVRRNLAPRHRGLGHELR